MHDIVILCKSYRNDVNRFANLAISISRFNQDQIPFYLCIPQTDKSLFDPIIKEHHIHVIFDEDILNLTMAYSQEKEITLPGNILQQVTKSEFWRLGLCKNFVMIDSDSFFIRDFFIYDFLWDEETPYTIINEGRHQREWAARAGHSKFLRQYTELRDESRKLFSRKTINFDFAPTHCIHSSKVWQALYETYAKPQGKSFYDQIIEFPCETQWYGEFLLSNPVIRLIPREPLFKVWGFQSQYEESLHLGETEEVLSENYLGIVKQSNWDEDLDYQKKQRSFLSRQVRKLKKKW